MGKELNMDDFLFDFESIFPANEEIKSVSEELNQKIFEENIFNIFKRYYDLFNHLPYLQHEFYLSEYDLSIILNKYQSSEDYKRLYVGFKSKSK